MFDVLELLGERMAELKEILDELREHQAELQPHDMLCLLGINDTLAGGYDDLRSSLSVIRAGADGAPAPDSDRKFRSLRSKFWTDFMPLLTWWMTSQTLGDGEPAEEVEEID